MTWLLLVLLAAAEASLTLLMLQLVVRCSSPWARWLLWLFILGCLSLGGLIVCAAVLSRFRPGDLWLTRQEILSLQSPFPTYRLCLMTACASPPLFWLLLGLTSRLQRGSRGPRVINWEISVRRSLQFVLATAIVLAMFVIINDRWICWRIEQVRARGRELATSLAPPPCPLEQNAAPVYLEIGAQIAEAHRALPIVDGNLLSLKREECTTFFAASAALAEKLRSACARAHCRFDTDFSDASILRENPEFRQLNACTHLLFLQGHRALLDGDADLAIENIVALRSMARQLAEDPRDSAFYSAWGASKNAASLIEHLCYVRQPTEQEVIRLTADSHDLWKRLDKLFRWLEAKYDFGVADDYFGLAIDVKKEKTPGFRFAVAAEQARMRMVYAPDDLRALPVVFPKIDEFVRLTYDELLRGAAQQREPLWKQIKHSGGGHLVNGWLDSDLRFLEIARMVDMRQRLADFGLTVVQRNLFPQIVERGAENVIPGPERPIDLFDGQPLRIVLADGGLVVYSVDAFGGDDGGSEGVPASVAGRYLRDMTFCIGEAYKVRRLTPPQEDSPTEAN